MCVVDYRSGKCFTCPTGEMASISPASDPPDPPDESSDRMEAEVTPLSSNPKKRHLSEDHTGPIKKTITNQETASASIQSIYLHPAMSVLGIRQYEENDAGPYIVHVSRIEPDLTAGTTIRPIKFGQFLFNNKIEGICQDGVKRMGRNKIAIQFKSAAGANGFLNNPILKTNKYEAIIPTYNVTRMGLVRGVPVDWSMDEFVESLQIPGPTYVLKARRLNRKNKTDGNIVWEPTQTVVLTFRGQQLPIRVFSFYSSLAVETYQFPTIQCMNCLRFGHIKAQCRSQPRCYRCTQPHIGDNCTIQEPEATCLYCSAHHYSTSRLCPEQERQKSIKMIMARDGISYQEACGQMPKVGRTYNQIAREPTVPHEVAQPAPPSSACPSQPVQSYKKTLYQNPRPRAPLGKSYDRVSHQKITANVSSPLPNGYSLQVQPSPSTPHSEPQDQLLVQLLTIIISIISQNKISLPSNVAQMISHLSSLIGHNGSMSINAVEQQEPPSEGS